MSGKLQDPEDPHHAEDLHHLLDSLVLVALHLRVEQDQGDEVGDDGQHVDDVESALHKVPLV